MNEINPGEDPELDAKYGAGTQKQRHLESQQNIRAFLQSPKKNITLDVQAGKTKNVTPEEEAAVNQASSDNMVKHMQARLEQLYAAELHVLPKPLQEYTTISEIKEAKELLVLARRAEGKT